MMEPNTDKSKAAESKPEDEGRFEIPVRCRMWRKYLGRHRTASLRLKHRNGLSNMGLTRLKKRKPILS